MKHCGIAILAVCLLNSLSFAAPTVYSGHTVTFTKAPNADPTDPANQDAIVSDVILTRGSTAGIYNIAQETSFTNNLSPAGTLWAFKSNNSGQTLAATNWAALDFDNWQAALSGAGMLATNIFDGDAVLYLVDHDIYLDIRFTAWGQGFGTGGSFSYERAEIPTVPEPGGWLLASLFSLMIAAGRSKEAGSQRRPKRNHRGSLGMGLALPSILGIGLAGSAVKDAPQGCYHHLERFTR